jgi:phospholipid N-methyltransferase
MKNLESKQIEQLLSIIPNHPALRIMHISQSGTELSDALLALVKQQEYELLLNIIDEDFYEESLNRYRDTDLCSVKKMKFEQRAYVSKAKMYDYIFVTANIPLELQEQFAKTVHGHIKNAGNIILFLEKDNLKVLDSWRQILEENYYVATNTIDLFKEYEIVISKKMHGWGG